MRIAHASIDERNKISGGQAGDQTGKEVCIRSYYDKNWQYCLRPKTSDLAEKSAKACEAMCANNHIGYDQNQRNTLITYLETLKWDYKGILRDTECDCSSFMTACALCGGAKIDYKGNAPTTSSMVSRFRASGAYDVIPFVSPKHNDLKRGDILVKQGSHTVMVLDDYQVQSKPVAPSSNGRKTLRAGDKGNDVLYLHQQLKKLKYGVDANSDYFSATTKQCVEHLQASNPPLKVDGIVGKNTWQVIDNIK